MPQTIREIKDQPATAMFTEVTVAKYDHDHTDECGECEPYETLTEMSWFDPDGQEVTDPDTLARYEAKRREQS